MKKILKFIVSLVILFIIGIAVLLTYINAALPDVGEAPIIQLESNAALIARGEYLANCVTVCMDCHSTRDWSKFSGPIAPGTLGKGGDRFDQSMGFPGVYYAKNISPAGIGEYTDGELYRVITSGVNKHGDAMFPVMPYLYYGKMADEDIYSIIAYIRSLDPIESDIPASTSDFPMNFILNTIPQKGNPQPVPSSSDRLAYGEYLTNAAACMECHTQVEKGQVIPALAFSGGRAFEFPGGAVLRSSNITPHELTGIGTWTEAAFINRFKSYVDSNYVSPAIAMGDFNSIMPWTMYGGMTAEDLGAIYTYLKSIEPIENSVVKWTPANSDDIAAE